MHVLVAEDDPLARKHLGRLLSTSGYGVTAVEDGAAAWSVFADPTPPQILVADWRMPRMDGLDLCRRIRSRRAAPYVYVVLVTAEDAPEALVQGFGAGADDFVAKPYRAAELLVRIRAGERLIRLQQELLAAQEELRIQATHDSLTRILNRGTILSVLARDCARAVRSGGPLSVVLADLDHFKYVNDEYGHVAGDVVLVESARRMREALRECDAIGRYGGEEFLMVLPDCDVDGAARVAERVRQSLADSPIRVLGASIPVTGSFGVASYDPRRDSIATVAAADGALYRAKAEGRNRVVADGARTIGLSEAG